MEYLVKTSNFEIHFSKEIEKISRIGDKIFIDVIDKNNNKFYLYTEFICCRNNILYFEELQLVEDKNNTNNEILFNCDLYNELNKIKLISNIINSFCGLSKNKIKFISPFDEEDEKNNMFPYIG